jgi:hypothetical protein
VNLNNLTETLSRITIGRKQDGNTKGRKKGGKTEGEKEGKRQRTKHMNRD